MQGTRRERRRTKKTKYKTPPRNFHKEQTYTPRHFNKTRYTSIASRFSKAPTPNTEEARRKKTKETQKSTVGLKIQNLRSQPVASYKTSQTASCI
jgi:hypothetical protein